MKKSILAFVLTALVNMITHADETTKINNSDELHKWIVLVQSRIYMNWRNPVSSTDNFDCDVKVNLNDNGEILSAIFVKSCENESLEKSILDAIWRTSPLPVPGDQNVIKDGMIFNFISD